MSESMGCFGVFTKVLPVATSEVSLLVPFEGSGIQSHIKRTDFLCSLGFESHRYSGTRDEINTPGMEMETGLMHVINRLE